MLDLFWPQGKVKGESGHRWSETGNRDKLFTIWQEDRSNMKPKCADLQRYTKCTQTAVWVIVFLSHTSRDSILLRCNLHRCNLTNMASVQTDGLILGCLVKMRTPQNTSKMWLGLQVPGLNFMEWNCILEGFFFSLDGKHTCRMTCCGSNVLTIPCSDFQFVVHFMSWGWR